MRALVLRRPAFQGAQEVDLRITCKQLRGLGHTEQTLLRKISTGGIWTDSIFEHAGFSRDAACQWCSEGCRGTLEHLWWG
eukprot:4660959-Alexandrium_andersonii.AAC.1